MRVATELAPMRLRSRRYRASSASNPPGQGHAEREAPFRRRGVPDAPRPRGRLEKLRASEREIDALPHRRYRARDCAQRRKMPRRVRRGLPFVRDRPLEPPRPTRAKRRELRRHLPRGRRLAFRVEREDHIPVVVRHRRPHRPEHRRPGRRDDRRGQRLEVAKRRLELRGRDGAPSPSPPPAPGTPATATAATPRRDRPKWPERAYMAILRNATRTILRCHTLRPMTTFPGANTSLADRITRCPSFPPWPCRRFRVKSPARGRLPSATGPRSGDA